MALVKIGKTVFNTKKVKYLTLEQFKDAHKDVLDIDLDAAYSALMDWIDKT